MVSTPYGQTLAGVQVMDRWDPRGMGAFPAEVPTTVYFGPWYGEFGHEIMWCGRCREQAQGYRKVVVCSRQTSAALYADFAHKFIPHDIDCVGMCTGSTMGTAPSQRNIMRFLPSDGKTKVIRPLPYRYNKEPSKYVRYGHRKAEWEGCIVFGARGRNHVSMRNWPVENWHRLARVLLETGRARRIVCIGTKDQSLLAEGACDMRGADLVDQMDVLTSAKGAVGPSSGTMHLASMCGCPHMVWCGGGPIERRETRARYERDWNPLGTYTHAYEYASWQPEFDWVYEKLTLFLDAVEAGGGNQDRKQG